MQTWCDVLQKAGIKFFLTCLKTQIKQIYRRKMHLHNQRGWWDCYGSVCQSAFQIVSHSLWSIAWEGEEQRESILKI